MCASEIIVIIDVENKMQEIFMEQDEFEVMYRVSTFLDYIITTVLRKKK